MTEPIHPYWPNHRRRDATRAFAGVLVANAPKVTVRESRFFNQLA